MTVKEILQIESTNTSTINLFKEGIFWRAYNQSAMRLCNCLQTYKVNIKYIKKVEQDIYYCGFPVTYSDKIIQKAKEKEYEVIRINEKQMEIKNVPIETIAYDEWKTNYKKKSRTLNEQLVEYHDKKGVAEALKQIREFPLESSSPMQTMLFVQRLKQMINE